MIEVCDCPFCGYDDVEINEVDVAAFSVVCPDCQATGPVCRDVMLAIADWNKAGKAVGA